MEGLKKPVNVEHYESVTIEGDLEWENDHENYERLSYLINNRVSNTDPQDVYGEVVFKAGVDSETVKAANPGLNGIDLEYIQADAVMKNNVFVRDLNTIYC